MEEEYNSLFENRTWDMVPLPSGRKLIRCRWVYKTNSTIDGQVRRYKSMIVSKVFQQVHGIDYEETYAPIEKMDYTCLSLSIVTTKGWEFDQMDVNNSFLHGDIYEEIHMEHP